MRQSSSSRRTQFSSCDACRQSRVACDASRLGHQAGQTDWDGSCSKCLSRNRKCTFGWIKKCPTRLRKQTSHPSLTPRESPDHVDIECSRSSENHDLDTTPREAPAEVLAIDSEYTNALTSNISSIDVLLSEWSERIFQHGFETIFGRWIGRDACPFVNDPDSDVSISPTRLFGYLDSYIEKRLDASPDHEVAAQRKERDDQIEQSLRRAKDSFTAQWLPAVLEGTVLSDSVEYERVIKERWRASRRDMLKVINRISYRSVLSLYLFGQTPIPLGISEEEGMDGISGLVCSQTALLQVQQLRDRLRTCQFNDSGALSSPDTSEDPGSSLTEAFLNFETRAYWAAVIWDSLNSMTMNLRSSLTSGLKGACLEPAWLLTTGFLKSFHARSEDWRSKGVEVTDEIASQIISAAAVCRLYTWKTIASVKEALREGVEESDLLFSWKAVLDAVQVFRTIIQPLLSTCERRIHFLGQVERLNWYEVVLHYHLGILMLAEALEGANRQDLLSQLKDATQDAEQESFNVLNFGLESRYTISGSPGDSCSNVELPKKPITTSFIAIDPFPNHVVASVRLVKKAITRDYHEGNIKNESYSHLSSTLLKALEEVSQSSRMVQSALENL